MLGQCLTASRMAREPCVALNVGPENTAARSPYASLGFIPRAGSRGTGAR